MLVWDYHDAADGGEAAEVRVEVSGGGEGECGGEDDAAAGVGGVDAVELVRDGGAMHSLSD